MGKAKFDFETELDNLDFEFGLPLYSFTQGEVEVVISKAKAILKAMIAEKLGRLPDLLDDDE